MILVDTSAWVDYLRGTSTRAATEVRRLIEGTAEDLVMCEPIAMELLAGASDQQTYVSLERMVNGLPSLNFDARLDFRAAASMFRLARTGGRTVRSLNDCLIATIALRHGATLVHKDVDFEVVASISALKAVSLR